MAALTIVAILQCFFPTILELWRRDYLRIAAGEWWRVVTALFVQDGGFSGGLFNLVSLLFVGSSAEWYWGSRRWLGIFVGGGLVSELVAMIWQPVGAGNSIANFCLAGSGLPATLSSQSRRAQSAALSALVACSWLLILRDIHGAAAFVGMMLGFILSMQSERKALGTEERDARDGGDARKGSDR